MSRLFGTDGVRGIANSELNSSLAYKLGRAGAYVLTQENKHKPRIAVGKDTRISGDMLEAALVAGICSMGGEAVVLDVMPTPAVAYLTRQMGLDAGVVISASHNPFEYNGIKFFNGKGYKLSDELEDKIQEIIEKNMEALPNPTGECIGKRTEIKNAVHTYVDFLKSTIEADLKGLKIVLDCANGASYIAAPTAFAELGAEILVINNSPDGININKSCGSTHPESLQRMVVESGSHLGLAFDGDADRLIAVDDKGEIVNGDHVMAIIAKHLKSKGKLKKDTVVATIMSNMGLEIACRNEQCNIVRTKVGDRYVLEEMMKSGYNLGGEQSGHIIFLDHNTTGDGLLTALQLVSVVKETRKRLSELKSIMTELPQVLVNARIKNEYKTKYMEDAEIKAAIENIEAQMKNAGRVVIRPSGTEPLVRVMLEGEDQNVIQKMAEDLAALIERKLS
ncbi:phosphoglucosamine mutase [Lutispora saccharofermentans]|uniref:Phosphoglucosamine mutase n=1 Tax=Lutispora saccharofermentans TaxID=3024236 RepID=A0ABT1NJP5_9FIRM|nr:phosphoglucosamine mutase [Lutispora saccharofermentans]MCQ1531495.1 phosphoglucosamine mutase [Lutispora saccharofermentans]